MSNLTIVGAGSWGTGLAWLLGSRGTPVRLWVRRPDLATEVSRSRVNQAYLPEVRLPDRIEVTAELEAAVAGTELVIVAVPSVGVAEIAGRLAPLLAPGSHVISAAKGLDHATGRRMTTVLADALGPEIGVGALSGPNLAHEIAAGQPSASVVATNVAGACERVQARLSSEVFRVYRSEDVAGVELGGALKNPLAIAAGISDGLGYGDNTKSALMTRGMHEIRRLGVALGAKEQTFAGLCGFGDLLATCHSRQSRNRNLGEELGRGRKLAEITAGTRQVAEGVPTTRTALRLAAEVGVEMPILEQLKLVLFDDKPIHEAARALMSRAMADEFAT